MTKREEREYFESLPDRLKCLAEDGTVYEVDKQTMTLDQFDEHGAFLKMQTCQAEAQEEDFMKARADYLAAAQNGDSDGMEVAGRRMGEIGEAALEFGRELDESMTPWERARLAEADRR